MRRDLIVIGASAGGVEALSELVGHLPQDLAAAVVLVLHTSPDHPSLLASILGGKSTLPVHEAQAGQKLEPGTVYVAVPDRHLMIEGNRLRLTRGPRESRARPSIDVLFRSAALARGPGTIGVVLTGALDDGTAGLWAIKDRGGVTVVQSPHEAAYPSMPQSALRHVAVDHVVPVRDMGIL
ncbi:MAG: chemotaxis protein CheB, partial [Gammaproteobacteria bacterium]|nr:chemotaxis protein CheB [Gammaproteobacteria bacterium]